MFAKQIIDSDAFIDMPVTARLLYYDLGMRADDDGFVNSPKKIMRMIGASQDDLAILITKKFIIPFDSGVVVIKHWRIHNYIRGDRKHDTKYQKEMDQITVKENGAYSLVNKELLEIEVEDNGQEETPRQKAYRESSLPYSFEYKIKSAFWGEPCPVCGSPMKTSCEDGIQTKNRIPTIQHNIPISKGGKHELGNISVICHQCNVSIKDEPTGKLNADEVIKVWDDICQSSDSQVTDSCPTEVRLGKDRLGKVKDIYTTNADEVIDYLNEKTGTKYRHSESSRKNIIARLTDGFTIDDCKAVIDKKSAEWMHTDMEKYLRPETLFRPGKFENYLNAPISKPKNVVIPQPSFIEQKKDEDPEFAWLNYDR